MSNPIYTLTKQDKAKLEEYFMRNNSVAYSSLEASNFPECERDKYIIQKALFPISQLEKVVVNTHPDIRKQYQYADVHTPDDSPKKEREYLLEHESTIEGCDIQERDQFYTAKGYRPSWIIKNSKNRVRSELEIFYATKKLMTDEFKAWLDLSDFQQKSLISEFEDILAQSTYPTSAYFEWKNINVNAFLQNFQSGSNNLEAYENEKI